MLLNQAQANAIYSAMCHLNNIGTVTGFIRLPTLTAKEELQIRWDAGGVEIHKGAISRTREDYNTQGDFRDAYHLQ